MFKYNHINTPYPGHEAGFDTHVMYRNHVVRPTSNHAIRPTSNRAIQQQLSIPYSYQALLPTNQLSNVV